MFANPWSRISQSIFYRAKVIDPVGSIKLYSTPSHATKNVCKTMCSMYTMHFPREKVLAINRFPKESRVPQLKPKKTRVS